MAPESRNAMILNEKVGRFTSWMHTPISIGEHGLDAVRVETRTSHSESVIDIHGKSSPQRALSAGSTHRGKWSGGLHLPSPKSFSSSLVISFTSSTLAIGVISPALTSATFLGLSFFFFLGHATAV